MGVAGARDVLGRSAKLHGDRRLRDHGLGVGAENVHAEHAVGFGIGEDFDEALRRQVGAGAGIGAERKFADLVGDAGGFKLLLGFADGGDFRAWCKPRSG